MSRITDTINRFKGKTPPTPPLTSTSAAMASSSSTALPSFRFSAAREEMVEVTPSEASVLVNTQSEVEVTDNEPRDTEESPPASARSSDAAASSISSASIISASLREPSPIKEALLTRFARLAPTAPVATKSDHAASDDDAAASSAPEATHPSSWLHSVKGRIAKTVEEKVTEYRNERERKHASSLSTGATSQKSSLFSQTRTTISLDLADDNLGAARAGGAALGQGGGSNASSTEDLGQLSHSLSESTFLAGSGSFSSLPFLKAHESEGFEHGGSDQEEEADTKTPRVGDPSEGSPKTPKERRRFTFSFLERNRGAASAAASAASSASATPSTNLTKTPEQKADSAAASLPSADAGATPRSSFRSRMMGLMTKASTPTTNVNGTTPTEDPFSGLVDLSPEFNVVSYTNSEHVGEDNVETAEEASEALVYEPSMDPLEKDESEVDDKDAVERVDDDEGSLLQHYWWIAGLPVCFLLFLQMLPLPNWILGFLTGVLIAVPSAVFVMWKFFVREEETKSVKFVENIRKKIPKEGAIIVQEEIERKYTWMNIWPTKNGPYDPLTYDVRRTMSVRIMLHGPWIELKFPKKNLPLRRMYDDVEPTSVVFLEHKEVLDLTNCAIDIFPENLPTKRIWSKKYPIRIRTNMRKSNAEDDACASDEMKPVDSVLVPDPATLKPEEEEEEGPEPRRDSHSPDLVPLESVFKDVDDDNEEEEDVMHDAIGDEDEEADGEPKREADENDASSFVETTEETQKTIYLFARTGREKEEWYNKLIVGAKFMQDWHHQNPPKEKLFKRDVKYETQKVKELRFRTFMQDYFQARHEDGANKILEMTTESEEKRQVAREQVAFLNIFGARLWHNLHNNTAFIDLLRDKLTRKLLKVKIAQYFEEVKVTTLDLGQRLPQVLCVSLPWQDEHGLWVNLEIEYNGICQATVETHGIRLPARDEPDREAQELLGGRPAATLDSDEEDSAEEDDNLPVNAENDDLVTGSASGTTPGGASLLQGETNVHGSGFRTRMWEGLLRSEFVANVARSEWVRKNITSKKVTLQLQLHFIRGTLTVNLPQAPSDRIWYGFRSPPKLEIALRPCFGGRGLGKYESTFSSVIRHLEKRLKQEFLKVLVYPNLDDEILPFLDHVSYSLEV